MSDANHMLEDEWLPGMYNKCLEALDDFAEIDDLTEEEIGIQNLCSTVVYLYNKCSDLGVPAGETVH